MYISDLYEDDLEVSIKVRLKQHASCIGAEVDRSKLHRILAFPHFFKKKSNLLTRVLNGQLVSPAYVPPCSNKNLAVNFRNI